MADKELSIQDQKELIYKICSSYIDLIKERLKDDAPDWTNKEFINNLRADLAIGDDEADVLIYHKGFIRKKKRLMVFARPVYGSKLEDVEFAFKKTQKEMKNIYAVFVFVGHNLASEAINFVTESRFGNMSLILVEPKEGFVYTDPKKITKLYANWFDPNKKPINLAGILKNLSEKISEKHTIDAKKVSGELELSDKDAVKFLKTCKFLEPVEGTDAFLFKQ